MQEFWSWLYYFRQLIDNILPISVLIVAVCAVYIAIQSRREARGAAHGSLFYQQMVRYSSIEMHEALRVIGKLFDIHQDEEQLFLNYLKKYHEKRNVYNFNERVDGVKTQYSLTLMYTETNQARYTVSQFFTLSFDLFRDFKVLDDVYFKKICSIDTFKYLHRVNEWLELALTPKYDRKTFTGLLEQSGRKDIEGLRGQRPPETWAEVEQMIQPKQPQSEQK